MTWALRHSQIVAGVVGEVKEGTYAASARCRASQGHAPSERRRVFFGCQGKSHFYETKSLSFFVSYRIPDKRETEGETQPKVACYLIYIIQMSWIAKTSAEKRGRSCRFPLLLAAGAAAASDVCVSLRVFRYYLVFLELFPLFLWGRVSLGDAWRRKEGRGKETDTCTSKLCVS